MSLFQCDNCGCCENTARASRGFIGIFEDLFDWSEFPDRKGSRLCSACGPSTYLDGKPSGYGQWHNKATRVYLPKGEFVTNKEGNLEHIQSGSTNYRKFALSAPDTK